LNTSFDENLVLFAAVKEFCKSIKYWQSYSHDYSSTLFWLTVYDRVLWTSCHLVMEDKPVNT